MNQDNGDYENQVEMGMGMQMEVENVGQEQIFQVQKAPKAKRNYKRRRNENGELFYKFSDTLNPFMPKKQEECAEKKRQKKKQRREIEEEKVPTPENNDEPEEKPHVTERTYSTLPQANLRQTLRAMIAAK